MGSRPIGLPEAPGTPALPGMRGMRSPREKGLAVAIRLVYNDGFRPSSLLARSSEVRENEIRQERERSGNRSAVQVESNDAGADGMPGIGTRNEKKEDR